MYIAGQGTWLQTRRAVDGVALIALLVRPMSTCVVAETSTECVQYTKHGGLKALGHTGQADW